MLFVPCWPGDRHPQQFLLYCVTQCTRLPSLWSCAGKKGCVSGKALNTSARDTVLRGRSLFLISSSCSSEYCGNLWFEILMLMSYTVAERLAFLENHVLSGKAGRPLVNRKRTPIVMSRILFLMRMPRLFYFQFTVRLCVSDTSCDSLPNHYMQPLWSSSLVNMQHFSCLVSKGTCLQLGHLLYGGNPDILHQMKLNLDTE